MFYIQILKLLTLMSIVWFSSLTYAKSNDDSISYQKISESLYILTVNGNGSKVGVSIGEDGVLVVDTHLEKHKTILLDKKNNR